MVFEGWATAAMISVLHLEDSSLDAEFVRDRLERADPQIVVDQVVDRSGFESKLQSKKYDVILSDYQVPTFEALEALDLARKYQPTTPFIFVSGAMGEEFAVETLKRGATDYVLKQNLARLPSAVARAIKESRESAELAAAAAAKREIEERLRFAHEAAKLGVWELDLGTGELICSDICKANLGLPPDFVGLTHSKLVSLILPEDRPVVERAIRESIENSAEYDVEYRVQFPNGEIHWLNVRGRLIRSAGGQPARMTGISLDITDRKRIERELAESESKFRQLANTIPNLAFMTRPDGRVFWYNDRWYEYTGTILADVEGWGWQSVHDADVLADVIKSWQDSLESETPFEMVFPIRGADRIFRPFLTRILPHRGQDGNVLYWFGTCTDISAQKQAEEQLVRLAVQETRRAELLKRLAEASRTVNAVLSRDGIVHVVAAEARSIADADVAVVEVSGPSSHPEPLIAVSATDDSDRQAYEDDPRRQLASSDNQLSIPLVGHIGKILGRVLAIRRRDRQFTQEDEAVLKQLAAIAATSLENARLYESLAEQDRRKDEFLATLAHELRNPLAPIRNGLAVLRLSPNGDGMSMLEMMERQLNQMVHLVDDLLDVSRVTTGKIALKPERVDLAAIIDSAVETSRPIFESAKHELRVKVPHASLPVEVDRLRMAQVMTNLLNNAAKYTAPGGRIELTAQKIGQQAVIRVSDTGIGIPAEMLPKIFDIFTQVGSTIDRSQGGLGIGLTLVRRLVEMHQGSVEASSPGLGKGSTFTVKLPLSVPTNRGSQSDGVEQQHHGIHHKRILVVDDNRDAAISTAMMLKLLGGETAIAHDGIEALEVAQAFLPNIVLMDVGMPRMNGYEAARQLRRLPVGDKLVIIALTGWGQEVDRAQSKEAGCDGHLVKPVELSQLLTLLTELTSST